MKWLSKTAAVFLAAGMATIGSGMAAAQPAAKAEDAHRVSFSVEREREVENDRVRVVLSATDEDSDPAAVARRINETMAWAFAKAKAVPAVRARSGSYQTYPVTEKGKIRRWRGSQEMVLESEDTAAAANLAGALQERLQMNGLDFSVSPERRRKVEDALIDESLVAMRGRADRIRKDLDATRFELLQARISTGGGGGPVPMMRMGLASAESSAAPPSFESGTSRVQVTVDATIRLH
jgi:predicted secreted protein